MTTDEFAEIISQKAREVFGQPSLQFRATMAFREIPGFDSILAIQYILTIENAFSIRLNEEQVDNMHTMGDLMRIVRETIPTA